MEAVTENLETSADGAGDRPYEFTAFYRAEQPGQVRRAALLLGSDELANDVVHEVLAAMYRSWSSIEQPGPYLNRAVLNRCREAGRDRTREARLRERLRPLASDLPADDVLLDIVAGLPFNQRAVVVLRFYAQMTEPEIAAALDVPTGSVGPWTHRALAKLRKELS
ncbi:MAG: hypothetical protein RI958_2292 [Actinomycetota bacterium]|jgi:RNA polymerase sigma factor (sigma-70 family)